MQNIPTEKINKLWADIYLLTYKFDTAGNHDIAKLAADQAANDFINSITTSYGKHHETNNNRRR